MPSNALRVTHRCIVPGCLTVTDRQRCAEHRHPPVTVAKHTPMPAPTFSAPLCSMQVTVPGALCGLHKALAAR